MAYAGDVTLTKGHRRGTAWRHQPPPVPKLARAPTESWWATPMSREQFAIVAAIQYETRMKAQTTDATVKRGRPRKEPV